MSETEVTTESQVIDDDNLDTFASDFFGEKKKPEPDAKPEVEQEPAQEQAEGETEAQNTESDPNSDPEAEFKEEPPKKKTVQDRIDELVRQREETKREADRKIEDMRREFEEKLAALKPAEPVQKATEPTPEDVDAAGEPKYPLGEFDPAYIRDLTRYTLEEERTQANLRAEQERKDREQEAAAAALQSSWNEKMTAAKEKYPDLTEKGQELLNGFEDLDQGYAGYLATVLMSMEFGPDVLHYLSNNPDEARKIVNSGAQKATLALGRIEAKFAEVEAQKVVAKPKISQAPPPPAAQARGTGGGVKTVEPDTDDLDAFSAQFFKNKRKRA